MKKLKLSINQSFRPAVSIIAVLLFLIQLHAQDGCSSFGWANYEDTSDKGAVTGGGNTTPVEVSTFAALKSAVESSEPKVIFIMNDMGNGYRGTSGDVLNFKSNKTLIGVKPGITIKCSFQIKNAKNIIVRNLIIRGPGNSNSEQNWDAVCIQGSQRVWFDHCTVMEGEDGNFDVIKGSDNVTASWCKFTYVTGGNHNLSNLIGSSDNEEISHNKLNVTFAYCWWENVNSRCPRTRYGKIHVLNSYYNNVGDAAFAGFMSNVRVEGCFFENNVKNPTGLISTGGKSGVFAIDCNRGSTKTDGYNTVFTPPYTYKKYANSEVKNMVTNPKSGAGPTLSNPTDCIPKTVVKPQTHENTFKTFSVQSRVSDNVEVNLNMTRAGEVKMSVLSLQGTRVAELKCICHNAGSFKKAVDLKGVQPGIYIFRICADDQEMVQRFIKH